MRVYNNDNGTEIARFDLSEDASTETAMVFGELYRHGAEWKFKAVGQGFAGGLGGSCLPSTALTSKTTLNHTPAMPGFFFGCDPLSGGSSRKGTGNFRKQVMLIQT